MGSARRFAEFGVVRRPDAEEPRVPRAGRATASGRGGLSAEDSDEHLTGSDSDHSEFDARMDVDSDHSAPSDSGRRSERSEEDEPSVKGKGKQRAGAALKRSRIVLSESESLDGEHGGGSEEDEPPVKGKGKQPAGPPPKRQKLNSGGSRPPARPVSNAKFEMSAAKLKWMLEMSQKEKAKAKGRLKASDIAKLAGAEGTPGQISGVAEWITKGGWKSAGREVKGAKRDLAKKLSRLEDYAEHGPAIEKLLKDLELYMRPLPDPEPRAGFTPRNLLAGLDPVNELNEMAEDDRPRGAQEYIATKASGRGDDHSISQWITTAGSLRRPAGDVAALPH